MVSERDPSYPHSEGLASLEQRASREQVAVEAEVEITESQADHRFNRCDCATHRRRGALHSTCGLPSPIDDTRITTYGNAVSVTARERASEQRRLIDGTTMSRKKISTTIYITPAQSERLKMLHARTKVPVAVYIREGIDMVLKNYEHLLPGQLSLDEQPPGTKAPSSKAPSSKGAPSNKGAQKPPPSSKR